MVQFHLMLVFLLPSKNSIEVLSAVMGKDTVKALGMKKVDPSKINLSMSDFVKPEQSKG